MNWWHRLKKNPLAKFGAILLLVFYISVIAADFVAPYNPYEAQTNGSLLPPTRIRWADQSGKFIGPHVYPTTQGKTDLKTGDRQIIVDYTKPSPIRLFVQGPEYRSKLHYLLNGKKRKYSPVFLSSYIFLAPLVKVK
jgi:peptide/nickel transport system permease protein